MLARADYLILRSMEYCYFLILKYYYRLVRRRYKNAANSNKST